MMLFNIVNFLTKKEKNFFFLLVFLSFVLSIFELAGIMSIIPFGLVGTIYGHFIWDVPMSMFTIVGLIGMTGIIINDSIVLISTIDEYSKERGIIPSIIVLNGPFM